MYILILIFILFAYLILHKYIIENDLEKYN